ncbi:MAG: glycosyltransferase family 39 protein [Deltaproteobacteria bacterium]|nr:glycosyltransferase family 39 protein [Deltaproteobacteria bacterium]
MSNYSKSGSAVVLVILLFILSIILDALATNIPKAEALEAVSRFFSFIGEGAVLGCLAVAIFIMGWWLKKDRLREAGRDGLFALFASSIAAHILKAAFERPRPSHATADIVLAFLQNPSLIDLTGRYNSFPSGHATVSFALASVIARKYPAWRGLAYYLALLIALSRVYLGSHNPSDVFAGAVVGLAAGYLVSNKTWAWRKWLYAGLILLTISLSFFKSGGLILFDVDEAVFSEASREMLETGDYITPTYNYEPRYDKPILIYWLMSASYKLLGVNEFSARAVSGVFGVLLVMMTFHFIKRVRGGLAAYLAAFALLVNIEFFVYSHSAVTDMTLTFFIAASIYSFFLAVKENNHRWFLAFWAAAGAAMLTKGVIGALFPLAIGFIFLAITKDLNRIRQVLRPGNIALFLVITVPWFAAEFHVNGWEWVNAFIMKHHVQRYSDVISSHSGPVYFYLGVLIVGFFPWVGLLPQGIVKAVKERSNHENALLLLSAIWFVFVLVFFSIARTKLPNYIFPLFPAGAILASMAVVDLIERPRFAKRYGLYLSAGIAFIIGVALFVLPYMNVRMDVPLPSIVFSGLGLLFVLASLFLISACRSSSPLTGLAGAAGATVAVIIVLRLMAAAPVNAQLQKDLYVLSKRATRCGTSARLVAYELNKPSIAFYAGKKATRINKGAEIEALLESGPLALITEKSRENVLERFDELEAIETQGRYVLLSNADCA